MMKYFFLVFSLFVTSALADARFKFVPEEVQRYSYLQFTWWGFKVYKAEIWTPKAKKPDFKSKLILHIQYQRNIKADKLVSTTREEWERLKLIKPESEKWLKALDKIWPDIKTGDSLTTYSDGAVTYFYQGDKLLGKVDDKKFGPLFLQIWLHNDSQTSELLKPVK